MTESGFTRRSLGSRINTALAEREDRGELTWTIEQRDDGRLVYVVTPGRMWAEPKPPTLRMGAGETADWLGIPVLS